MARAPVMAAGGIVLRRGAPPLIAIVRQRKRNEWVLPKGKLDDGETPKQAAHREVLEETGHEVAIHEFLGTLVYQSGGRAKVVHFWRMEAEGGPVRKLMNDIKAVDWLPLEDALARLSREYERVFLTQIGPIALAAAGLAPTDADITPPLATEDIDAVLQTLTPAEPGSVDELPHGLLQKMKAWLRGEA
ncbi:NUDIX hydrolase [Bradyrhizobium diazoefficiens]|jgi:8-oxo-dGTP diphosphatase|nr:NUDIX hydrolase [Bradyrhizobium diazoefficiens]UCF50852.1 MAG: NUDIX hydrolase [Bradyrhizobium sp.]MBR0963350.1 NUDIX hydrolase [Bradyrhizobium diazoefficiens]MBR0976164.1 NUDIX hydrolase [Bradyrhizobium diazoefficiens]MBR1007012.1 NUDIX hydrolase [Bradyrhizobium diazoefficiens]MBR1013123.1 NUDIX hydrolase [Bradyrhizobium diazoefficiens]